MQSSTGFNMLNEQIKAAIRKESPNIMKTAFRDIMKNDPRYRKEMVDIIKKEMTAINRRVDQGVDTANSIRENARVSGNEVYGRTIISGNPGQGNGSLYKQMKNKITYGVNTDKGSTLTNNGKFKIV